jgi:glycosyltransferase involved in cell wall biosynthesis
MHKTNGETQLRVICFSEIQWRYVRTRKQQILSRFPPGHRILFLSTVVRGRRSNFLPRRDGNVLHVCIPVLKNFPQKWARALFAIPPVRFLWNLLLIVWLEAIFIITGFAGPGRVFYVSNIYYSAVIPFFRKALVLYDCNDDPLSFPGVPGWADRYFKGLVRQSDVITAVSTGLVALLKEQGAGRVELLGNGVDFDLFRKAAESGAPAEMNDLPRPVIGYVGAIAHWFDFDLVSRIATAYGQGTVVLVGPVFRDLKELAGRLAAGNPNIKFLGEKPYERLGAYLASMDVCMIPLVVNELRRLADPNKLYEYAASGRPIVTMNYSDDIASIGDMIYIAGSKEEFVEKIGEALEKGADGETLMAFARDRSWQSRARAMLELIEEELQQKR